MGQLRRIISHSLFVVRDSLSYKYSKVSFSKTLTALVIQNLQCQVPNTSRSVSPESNIPCLLNRTQQFQIRVSFFSLSFLFFSFLVHRSRYQSSWRTMAGQWASFKSDIMSNKTGRRQTATGRNRAEYCKYSGWALFPLYREATMGDKLHACSVGNTSLGRRTDPLPLSMHHERIYP